jgi:lipoate-protein ligase A
MIPNTIRFLQFDPPAVLVGYHQAVEQEVRIEYCKSKGIDINRRITGGGAIFFDRSSLGWEIIASKLELGYYQNIEELYGKMCEGAILGLENLGISAAFRPKNDIEVDGRKISGTGGTEWEGALLFQGTLLIDFDIDTMLRALRIPIMKLKDKEVKSVRDRVTCVKWELGHNPSMEKVKQALKAGFEKAFKVKLIDGGLTREEEELLKEKLSVFQSDEWIFLERRPLCEVGEVHAIAKTRGGLIRVSLIIDRQAKIIKDILITGDFFAYPSRAIIDLEAMLKCAYCNEEEIRKIVHSFFRSGKAHLPGVAPEHIVKLILEAIGKMEYESLGIDYTEANHIYPILKSVKEILNDGCDVLLLPYCAKLPACEYRRKEGCLKCGKCSVGAAYEIAEEAGLTPITIQNFEHLMETLHKLKTNGVKGYIGCCCEAFICKHQDDMENAGIPGILVDIDNQTCYDLRKEEEAFQGKFESQTELKIDLIRKLVNNARRQKGLGV